jgi:glycosyltransferase involved in cell wall biosynthesis
MADIGVYHDSILEGGGAEVVAVSVIEALSQADNDVTLYTTAETNAERINERYQSNIPASRITVINPSPTLSALLAVLCKLASTVSDVEDLLIFRAAMMELPVRIRYLNGHDSFISTQGTFFHDDVIQYVHFPYYSRRAMCAYTDRFADPLYPAYHAVCRSMKRIYRAVWGADTATITNSAWTSEVTEAVYDVNTEVVYPPVEVNEFSPPNWEKKEDGFVTIGRVHPEKRQHVLIGIVEELVERGYSTHLHIIGPLGDSDYCSRIRDLASERDYIHVEGRVSRSEVVSHVEAHKFGIHAKQYEHFGIAIAELLAGHSIPLVPAGGGQAETVKLDALTYTDVSDAAEKAAGLLDGDTTYRDLFADTEIPEKYSKGRFNDQILRVMNVGA